MNRLYFAVKVTAKFSGCHSNRVLLNHFASAVITDTHYCSLRTQNRVVCRQLWRRRQWSRHHKLFPKFRCRTLPGVLHGRPRQIQPASLHNDRQFTRHVYRHPTSGSAPLRPTTLQRAWPISMNISISPIFCLISNSGVAIGLMSI